MRVLSLFDGISCGQVALERAGVPVEVYYSSEIDKYAIQIAQKNYPDTIQLGDINDINFNDFIGRVDLIMGGSPCQDLSIAGKRKGLAGERSGLFYKFVEAIEVIKPKYFLLENNVGMPKEAYEEISRLMGCYPVLINSALVSAQTRKRFYWTNIGPQLVNLLGVRTCNIPQPENKGILLKDVLEKNAIAPNDKSRCIQSSIGRTTEREYFKKNQGQMVAEPLAVKPCALRNRGNGKQPEFNNTDKANALTSVQTDSMVCEPICLNSKEGRKDGKSKQPSLQNRIYSIKAKSVTMSQFQSNYKIDLPDGEYLIRKLTPLECERLQTLPDNYTEGVSNTQRYKAIGNGWTVDVIAHIFSFLKDREV